MRALDVSRELWRHCGPLGELWEVLEELWEGLGEVLESFGGSGGALGELWEGLGRLWGHFPGVELRSEAIGDSHLAWGCYIWKVFRWDVQKSILRGKNIKKKSSQNMVCLPLKLPTKPV